MREAADASLTIGRLAQAGGVGVETVRYYQRRGLLHAPPRPRSGSEAGAVRRYGDEDVRRLRFIRAAQGAGFTLEQISELLSLDSTQDRARALALTRERLAALDRRIIELTTVRDALENLAGVCSSGPAGPCPILRTFERGA